MTVTRYPLQLPSGESRCVIQFHFTRWPDFGAPSNPYDMLHFVRLVRAHTSEDHGPLVVHCRWVGGAKELLQVGGRGLGGLAVLWPLVSLQCWSWALWNIHCHRHSPAAHQGPRLHQCQGHPLPPKGPTHENGPVCGQWWVGVYHSLRVLHRHPLPAHRINTSSSTLPFWRRASLETPSSRAPSWGCTCSGWRGRGHLGQSSPSSLGLGGTWDGRVM